MIRDFKKERMALLLMALPFMALVVAFYYVPLFGWTYAFFDYTPGVSLFETQFIGLKNFIMMFSDITFLPVMRNTLIFSLLGLLISPIPVILAILLNEVRNRPFKKAFQTITTLPNFVSWIIVYSLAFCLFSSDGMVNQLLLKLNLVKDPVNILGNASIVYFFQTILMIWKYTGWNAIIYLAAITGIDNELYDAAKVDGAGRFKTMLHITVPGIIPTFLVLLLLSISNILSVGFEQFLVFYNGSVGDFITVLDIYVYKLGIAMGDYSYATAVGILKTLISIGMLFSVNMISKKARGESLV